MNRPNYTSDLKAQMRIRLAADSTYPFNAYSNSDITRTYLIKNTVNGEDPANGIDHMVVGDFESCLDAICDYAYICNSYHLFNESMRYITSVVDKKPQYMYNETLRKYGAYNFKMVFDKMDMITETSITKSGINNI